MTQCECGAQLPNGDENPGGLFDLSVFGPFFRDGVARCRPCNRIRRVHGWRGLVVVISTAILFGAASQEGWMAAPLLLIPVLHWWATRFELRDAERDRDAAERDPEGAP